MNPNTKQQVEWLHINLGLNFLEIPELYLDEGESDEEELLERGLIEEYNPGIEQEIPELNLNEAVDDQEELLERGLIEEYNPGIDREIEKMPENAGLDDDKSPNLQGRAGLRDDLEQIERVVIHSNKPTKPAILEGMFKSVQSVLSSVERQLVSFMATEKEQQEIRSIAGRVKDNLLLARETQVQRSLDELTEVAKKYGSEAERMKEAERVVPNGDHKARGSLYLEASEVLTELGHELADWEGQVKEAKNLIMDKTGDFQTQLEIMERAENSIDKVVENCLPKLTSRVPNPGENLPLATNKQNATTQVPEIKKGDELKALEDCGLSWVTAKQKYGANKDEMQKLANYRKLRVDKWLQETLAPWGMTEGAPDKGWVSVGSSDPTSDYDISLNRHGLASDETIRYDYQLVQDFNAWFRNEFKGEGGTVFDTNLYASAPPAVKDDEIPGAKSIHDIAALMKMRRYMTSGEFEAFRVETAEACGEDLEQRMEVEQQFAMADNNYRIVVADLLENGRKMLEKRIASREPKSDEERNAHSMERAGLSDINDWFERGKTAKFIEAFLLAEEGEELLRVVEHLLKDATLETTNEAYAERIGQVRGQEQVCKILKDLNAKLSGNDVGKSDLVSALRTAQEALGKIERTKDSKGNPLYYESTAIVDAIGAIEMADEISLATALVQVIKKLSKETEMRLSQLGSSKVISKFFANEAYQSDGPFAHVVTATQAAEADALSNLAKEIPQEILDFTKTMEKDQLKTQLAVIGAGGVEAYKCLGEQEQKTLLENAQKKMNQDIADLKKLRQAELPKEQCLQSFNEQLGDFLKDLEHYGEEEAGKAIIQSSKYLERLLDATRLLKEKDVFQDAGDLISEIQEHLDLQSDIKGQLIAARKGNLTMLPLFEGELVDKEEQRRAFACDFMKNKLKVNSVAGLSKKYVKFGVKVNAAARKALSKK